MAGRAHKRLRQVVDHTCCGSTVQGEVRLCAGVAGDVPLTAMYSEAESTRLIQHVRQHSAYPANSASSKLQLTAEEWQGMEGKEVGTSPWFLIDQERVDAFTLTTMDPQWIHQKDAQARGSPFGGPIVHGFLSLSLISMLAQRVMPGLQGATMGVNYGFDKVRFIAPVPVGQRVRLVVTLKRVKPLKKGLESSLGMTLQVEGQTKPALVADWITRAYFY